MKKGKLKLTADSQSFSLSRIYINSWDSENTRFVRDPKWNAFEGMAYWFRTGRGKLKYSIHDEKGKDLSDKVKNSNSDWASNMAALTLEMRKEKNKSNTNIFGKEKEFIDYKPVSSFSKPFKPSEEVIEKTVRQFIDVPDQNKNSSDFFKKLFQNSLSDNKDADVALERFFKIPGVAFVVEFDIEWEKFDFEKLEFLFSPCRYDGVLDDFISTETALLNAIIYDRKLYFGNVRLVMPETDKVILEDEIIADYSTLFK